MQIIVILPDYQLPKNMILAFGFYDRTKKT